MLDQITPIILTWNEAPNIGRTLDQLQWARDIIVVDSLSDTRRSISSLARPNSSLQAAIRFAEDQWNFALCETGFTTEWVLALDADYLLPLKRSKRSEPLKPSKTWRLSREVRLLS